MMRDEPPSFSVGAGTDAWRERLAQSRGRIVLVVLLVVSMYFLAAFGEQALRIRELQAQTSDLEAGNSQLQAENSVLSAQLAQWDAGGYLPYVEGRARRDLLLARSDESVIAVRWHDPAVLVVPQQQTTTPEDSSANWRRWLNVLTGTDDAPTDADGSNSSGTGGTP